jgi:hypothetical protein
LLPSIDKEELKLLWRRNLGPVGMMKLATLR